MVNQRISVGAYSDLQRANEIARMMVEELAMTEALGPMTFNDVAGGRGSATGVGKEKHF